MYLLTKIAINEPKLKLNALHLQLRLINKNRVYKKKNICKKVDSIK
jgi:hypothetical protein